MIGRSPAFVNATRGSAMNRRFENLFEIDPLHEGMTRFVLCARRKNSSSPVVFLVNLAGAHRHRSDSR